MSADTVSGVMPGEPLLIPVSAPFDLRLTVGALRRLPQAALYPLEGDEWRVVAALPSGSRLLAVRPLTVGDSASALALIAPGSALNPDDAAAATALIRRMLDVERDLQPLRALVAQDATLGPLAQRLAGMKPPRFASLWEAFCQIVPFQQVSLSAAVATLNRFVMALGPAREYEGRRYWGVPSPERVLAASGEEMRACGLSAAKAQTLRGLAERTLAGDLDTRLFDGLSDEAAIAGLTRLPGIGRWSAQVALLRGLGRLSVFPSGDSGAARALRDLFPEREATDTAGYALLERLGDRRGYLYFMLLGRRLLTQTSDA